MREQGILKGSLWIISGQFLSMALQAAYFVLMGRALGSREYGAFVGVVALVALLTQFSSLGMEMILLRNISRDRASFAATWGNALRISACGFVVLLAVASLIGRLTLRPELRALIPWIALSDALFGKLVQLASRAFQGAGEMRYCAKLATSVYAGRAALAAGLFVYVHRTHAIADAYMWARIYWLAPFVTAMVALCLVTARLVPGLGDGSPLAVPASAAARAPLCVGDHDHCFRLAVEPDCDPAWRCGVEPAAQFPAHSAMVLAGGGCGQPDYRWLAGGFFRGHASAHPAAGEVGRSACSRNCIFGRLNLGGYPLPPSTLNRCK
jgi:Polysaccharide biosynthesis protein